MPEKTIDVDWAALVDLFAREYGWTIKDICELDMGQVVILIKQIRKRYKSQNPKADLEDDIPDVPADLSDDQQAATVSDFIKMGGKRVKDEDGTERIII